MRTSADPGRSGAGRSSRLTFIGVSTARSSIRTVFPRWAAELGLGNARLVGVDLPPGAPREVYRAVVDDLARDPRSAGALVTTHKIDLYRACEDMFDAVDPLARLLGEVSCLRTRGGRVAAHAKDPVSAGLAIDALLARGHFARTGADALLLGAGGAAAAIAWCLTRPDRTHRAPGDDRPPRLVVSDRSPARLAGFGEVYRRFGTDVPVETVHARTTADNDAAVGGLRPGSLVVNATGLGKDAPGSPLSDAVGWPPGAVAWDLNYRGALVFLDQARAAGVRAADGWVYFLHGWTQVIAEVFDVAIPSTGPRFEALGRIAADVRR